MAGYETLLSDSRVGRSHADRFGNGPECAKGERLYRKFGLG
jgi:hypothetical protein